ncbi:phage tail protein, partial [Escherichia coli]|nr:phage tail protein [Escherichia coli]MCQ1804738.1 phage tail protein [Escherichia coli]
MPVSHYLCIFINVGLGEAAKLPAISGSLSSSGWIKIPVIEGKSFIIQWGRIGPS